MRDERKTENINIIKKLENGIRDKIKKKIFRPKTNKKRDIEKKIKQRLKKLGY